MYMVKTLEQTDYFSEESGKMRYPDLYQHMIGQHLTEAEVAVRQKVFAQTSLSSQLMEQLERQIERFVVLSDDITGDSYCWFEFM